MREDIREGQERLPTYSDPFFVEHVISPFFLRTLHVQSLGIDIIRRVPIGEYSAKDGKMDAPTIQPKFLKNASDLGLVAVGFSGGQV